MTDTDYVWQCLDGHEYAVSELMMETATVQPRCMKDKNGQPCGARLARRLRAFSPA